MEPLTALFLFAAAFAGGAVNSVAGGGTFLTFPVLIFSGFTAFQANVTSTLALWPGSVASAYAYRNEWKSDIKRLPGLVIISLVGSAFGTWLLLTLPEAIFESLVPWLLLIATLIFTFGRSMIGWAKARKQHLPDKPEKKWVSYLLQITIAIYGGYFGAGIGILMLAMLQMMGLSHMHHMNGLKTVLGAAINLVAVVMFIASGSVLWQPAAVMIAGGIAGGYVGARLALKAKPEYVRVLVIVIASAMTAYFFVK